VWGRGEVATGFWFGSLKERDRLIEQAWMEGEIKANPQEIGRGRDWNALTVDRDKWQCVLNTASVLSGSIKCWEFHDKLRNY
jgi:hypothetical protein